jgi:hypothetical protein
VLSYTANFEDVLLERCFRDVEQGFFIDIGAHITRRMRLSLGGSMIEGGQGSILNQEME